MVCELPAWLPGMRIGKDKDTCPFLNLKHPDEQWKEEWAPGTWEGVDALGHTAPLLGPSGWVQQTCLGWDSPGKDRRPRVVCSPETTGVMTQHDTGSSGDRLLVGQGLDQPSLTSPQVTLDHTFLPLRLIIHKNSEQDLGLRIYAPEVLRKEGKFYYTRAYLRGSLPRAKAPSEPGPAEPGWAPG